MYYRQRFRVISAYWILGIQVIDCKAGLGFQAAAACQSPVIEEKGLYMVSIRSL
jgi:hypothetical protein